MDTKVEDFLNSYPVEIRDLMLKMRTLILEMMPDAIEHLTAYKSIAFGTSVSAMKDDIFYIAPFKSHINLGFMRGGELPDPKGVLEGTGKLLRHVKIKKAEDLEKPGLRELMIAAIDHTVD